MKKVYLILVCAGMMSVATAEEQSAVAAAIVAPMSITVAARDPSGGTSIVGDQVTHG